MAEGGGKFGYKEGDTLLGHTDDRDDYGEKEAERTQPFEPDAWSTPYHRGETIEMQTWQHEQTGLPETSYVETSRKITDEEIERRLEALRDPNTGILPDSAIPLVPPCLQNEQIKRVRKLIKALYPNAKVEELDIKFSKNKIVVVGPRGGETKIALERESELKRQNEEDQEIIRDENALPSDIKDAEDRVPERNEEIARLQTEIV